MSAEDLEVVTSFAENLMSRRLFALLDTAVETAENHDVSDSKAYTAQSRRILDLVQAYKEMIR